MHLGFIKTCKGGAAGWGLTGGICGESAALACHGGSSGIEMMGQIMAHEIGHVLGNHSSEKRGLRTTKCSSKMLRNMLYFMYKKTHVFFVCFSFRATLYFYGLFIR